MIDKDAILAIDAAYAKLAIGTARADELTIELNQLKSAIENLRERPSFNTEPSDFRAALLALAVKQ